MSLITNSPLRTLIVNGDQEKINGDAQRTGLNLRDHDLRNLDLRGVNLRHADLRGAYLRAADLRGVDLSAAKLDGASLHGAKVSGVLFPRDLAADEIRLSIEFGTRMRSTLPER
ncbi:MAG: pentapeptide repeat-containing protein [Myxococcota bacterium]